MKKFILIFATVTMLFSRCEEAPSVPHPGEENPSQQAKNYPAHVAVSWINLQQHLIKTTPGFDPLVASRAFAYSALAMYESVVKGMPGYQSVASPRIGVDINEFPKHESIYWPASVNASMASILKSLFGNTSEQN